MRYELCTPLEATQACAGLINDAWIEAGQPETDRLELDYSIYEALSQAGSFAYLAKDGDVLAGYVVVFMTMVPHTSARIATNDVIYVRPSYRPRGIGGRLIVLAEAEARRRGALRFQWACNVGSHLHRALAKRPHTMQQIVIERQL